MPRKIAFNRYYCGTAERAHGKLMCSQINLQHCKMASAHLYGRLAESNCCYISLIQEPYCPFGKVVGVPPNANCHGGKTGKGPRAVVLTSKSINALTLLQFTDRDCSAVLTESEFGGKTRRIVFCSAYLPYDSTEPPPSSTLVNLVNFCEKEGYGLIIGSDANAHHTAWGSSDCNQRGEQLLEFVMGTDLMIINEGNKPTFETMARKEVLDITLASLNIANQISKWEVSGEYTHSDHKEIQFLVLGKELEQRLPYRNIRKTDWDMYLAKLSSSGRKYGNKETSKDMDVDEQIGNLQRRIYKAFTFSCKATRPKNKQPVPWWSEHLASLHKEVSRLHRIHQRAPNEENLNAFKEARRSFKREVRKAKRESWANYCSSITAMPQAARLNAVLKRGKREPQGTMKRADGTYTSNPEETLDLLLETHFPDDESTDRPEEPPITGVPKEIVDLIVKEDKLEEAFKSFKPFKASGPDGIFPALIQKGMEEIRRELAEIYKKCLTKGYIPQAWRRTRAVFIPKPGKDDYSSPNSYRPISLSSFLLKGLERLVYWYLIEHPLKQAVHHQNQHAYTAGKSTLNALHELVSKIEKAYFNNQSAIAVFLDIEGAFNNAQIGSMIQATLQRDVNPNLSQWIGTLLSTRIVESTQLGKTRSKKVTKGCPQGGILSPLLWNLIVDSLLKKNTGTGVHMQAYADDVALLITGPHISVLGEIIQHNLKSIEKWAVTHKLRFSPKKTEVIAFTRKRVRLPELRLYGEGLAYSKQVKYLGVTLDHKLNWTPHIKMVTQKATMALYRCRRAIGPTWGITPATSKWMYTGIVRPIIQYASMIWCPALNRVQIQNALNKLQRKALVSITSAYPSTPTKAMEVLLNIPPLHIYLEGEATKMASRLRIGKAWRGDKGDIPDQRSHINCANRLLNESKILQAPVDRLAAPKRLHKPPYRVEISTREEACATREKKRNDEIECFTDGSVM